MRSPMTPATKTVSEKKTEDGKGRLLLVVDGDEHHRSYHTMLLQRFAYRVRTAANAEEAIGMIVGELPDLIISELVLPNMSGLDLLSSLRKEERTARIPVIALTAGGDHGTEDRCLRAGFAACLGMPLSAEELYRTVQAAIEPRTRRSRRVHIRMPIMVNAMPLDCVDGECASVISEHGMYIRTLTPYPPNARVDIRIDLEGRSIAAEAVVIYSHRSGEGPFGEPGMGIKFARMAPQDQEFIRLYIRNETTSQ